MKTHYSIFSCINLLALSFLIHLFPNSSNAQESLLIDWENEITNTNGSGVMELTAIQASDGFSYVAGSSSTDSGQKMYVARYDANGDLDWELNLASEFESQIVRLILQGADVFVAGTEEVGASGNPPIHYARLSTSGDVIWHLNFDAQGADEVEFWWMEFANNRMYMVGTEAGENDYSVAWAAEFELDGGLNWKSTFDPGVNTVFVDINANIDGEVAACGWTDYGYSYVLVSFNSNGSVNWQFPEDLTGGDSEQWFNDLSSDSDGNWIAVGSEEVGSFSEYDAITYKFDQDGNELWNQHYNNGYENNGSLLEVMSDGSIRTFVNKEEDFDNFVRTIAYNSQGDELWATDYSIDQGSYIIQAVSTSSSELFLAVQDYDFMGIVKISSTGEILETQTYDDTDFDYLEGIAIDNDKVYSCTSLFEADQSTIISLEQGDLSEHFTIIAMGPSSSDARVGAVENNGDYVWVSDCSFGWDTSYYSISKMDYSGNLLWSSGMSYQGNNPKFEHLESDGSGNVVGFFKSLINGGVTDLGLVKYDADGNEVFFMPYDSSATLYPGSITIDPNDNIYVGGYAPTSKLMFLSKLEPNGNVIWTDHYESESASFPYAIPSKMIYTDQDKLVIGGIHRNALDVNNLYLFQYSSDGEIEWETEVVNQVGNTTAVAGLNVADDGTVTIFGSSGTGLYVAARYDSGGNQQWIETGNLMTTEYPRSMAVDDAGNSYLCFSSSTGMRVIKLDTSGNVAGNEQFSLESDGFYFPLGSATINGKLAIIGDHLTEGLEFPFEMLLDDQLNLISGRVDIENAGSFGGFSVDDSDLIHAAFTQGEFNGGPGFNKALVRQYSIGIVGVEELTDSEHSISIYPNPTHDDLTITWSIDLPEITRLSIVDLTGRVIYNSSNKIVVNGKSGIRLNLPSNLKSGQYILRLDSKDSFYTERFVKY